MELKKLATGRMTRKGYVLFGRIRLCLDKPGQEGTDSYVLFGRIRLCLNRKPPSDHISFGIAPIKRVPTAMLDEQEASKSP